MSDTPVPVDPSELEGLSPTQAAEWVAQFGGDLTPAQRDTVEAYLRRQGPEYQMALDAVTEPPAPSGADVLEEAGVEPSSSTILEGMSPTQAVEWAYDNALALSPADLAAAINFAERNGEYSQVLEVLNATATGNPTPEAMDIAARQRTESIAEAASWYAEHLTPEMVASGETPDLPTAYLPAGMSTQERDRFVSEAYDAGWATAQEQAAEDYMAQNPGMTQEEVDDYIAGLYDQTTAGLAPSWMLTYVGGGRNLTKAVQERFLDYWNDDHGTYFTSFSQLVPLLEQMGQTTYTEEMTQAAIADQQPLLMSGIKIPFVKGSRTVNYSEDSMAALREMGYDNDAITRLVRLAGFHAGADSIVGGENGDTIPFDDLAAIAGLTRYYGGGEEFSQFDQTSQDIAALEQQLGLKVGAYRNMTASQRRAYRNQITARATERMPLGGSGAKNAQIAAINKIENLLGTQAAQEQHGTLPGVLSAQNNYGRGLSTYNGDSALAFIHAVDPALAQRIAASGQDPTKLSWQDNRAALDALDRGGLINRSNTFFGRLGGRIQDHIFNEASYFDTTGAGSSGGSSGGGSTTQRRLLDPVSVKEQLQQQYADFMIGDIPDDVVTAFTSMLQAQLDAADPGMTFDYQARILDWVQGRPEYAALYNKKPSDMTESDYQSTFISGVSDMLGSEGDRDAVKAGMRSGEYQAAVGVAGIGGLAGQNSRLLGKWALAKQTLDKFT